LNDSLYSHGNDYIGYGKARYPEEIPTAPASQPAAAPQQAPTTEPEPYTLPGPAEQMPVESSGRVMYDEFGQQVSYEEPSDRRGRAARPRQSPSARAAYHGPVDSRQASRKLAKPPRTRLFSR
jgi:hypothetical protein